MNKVKLVLKLILMGIAIEIAASYILTLILSFMPEVGAEYESNISRLTSMSPKMLLLVCIIAPALEELIFRGLLLGVLKRFIPFIIANVTQALAFGIYHGNLIQGIYAFLLGLLIGYVMYLTGSFIYTIILHMSINIMGMFIGYIIPKSTNELIKVFVAFISLLVIIGVVRGLKSENDRLVNC